MWLQWRYASAWEVCASVAAVALAWACSVAQVGAILVYGELTSLFVLRHTAAPTLARSPMLGLAGGAEPM